MKTIPDDFLLKVYTTMFSTPQHIYLILTKRPQKMFKFIETHKEIFPIKYLWDGSFNNIFHGTTCESQQRLAERLPYLLQVQGKKFLSLEPLLSDFNFRDIFWGMNVAFSKKEITQIICGAETGHHARPCNLDWIRSIRDQCKEANIPLFIKSIGKQYKKDMSDWPDDLRIRELVWRH